MTKASDPAFPRTYSDNGSAKGMTMREWYAGQALTGLLRFNASDYGIDLIVRDAFRYADAMLRESQKENAK